MNNNGRRRFAYITGLAALMIAAMPVLAFAEEAEAAEPALYATPWAVLPPLIAIGLALITKEVYSSLFIGCLSGAVLYAGFNLPVILEQIVNNGIVASLSDSYNVGILVFLVILGIFVAMMNITGGSSAFSRWAATKVKSRTASQITTILLGILIFVDDYFNCLTVGSVMKPLTDRYEVSRAKLAYLIDATAAPVCIIAPISSWAAAVSGFVEGQNGLTVFIKAIPYNFYALLTILMMFLIISMKFDYGKMAVYERNAIEKGDLFTVKDGNAQSAAAENVDNPKASVLDLILPVAVLILSCVIGMIYTGGFFSGESFIDAFANCDAAVSLSMGSLVALIITIIYYMIRRVASFTDLMGCVPEGFKQMVSPITVLTLAWTLKAMTDSLGLSVFVAENVAKMPSSLFAFVPAILFLIACVLAFASGTSWGTFGILIPIALTITETHPELTIPVVSACMAGAVCGDHCSPISDTTIMASAGAGCNHIAHVETQLPYALTVLLISTVSYIVVGFTKGPWIGLIVGIILLFATLTMIKKRIESKKTAGVIE